MLSGAAIESILTFSITGWYSSACQKDKDQLERIVRTASKIIGSDMKPDSSACQKDKDQLERIVRTASKIIGSDMKPIASIHSLRPDRKVMAIV